MKLQLFELHDAPSGLRQHLAVRADSPIPTEISYLFAGPLIPTRLVIDLHGCKPSRRSVLLRNAILDRGWEVIGSSWQPPPVEPGTVQGPP